MVNVLVIADEVASNLTEHTLRDISPDLVLSAGDLPWDYVEWVADTAHAPTVFVPGNHDPEQDRRPDHELSWQACNGGADAPRGVINADQQVVEAAGLRIAGLGGCVRYNRGAHQYSQRQYKSMANRLVRAARGPVDVLLTHAPPLGLGDGEDGPHIGIEALHRVLGSLQPTYHVHGHIHPYGRPQPDRHVGPTTIVNVIPWKVVDITPRLEQVALRRA
jgi:Icc-related predicted phosphoesterase